MTSPDGKENKRSDHPDARVAETARQEREQGGQPQARDSGDPTQRGQLPAGSDSGRSEGGVHDPNHPENQEGAAKATNDNDLTAGHSARDDGGADNAKRGQ
jgi:hypothetical protein